MSAHDGSKTQVLYSAGVFSSVRRFTSLLVRYTMSVWLRRLAPLVVAAICAGATSSALAGATGEPLAGTWTGVIAGHPGYRMVIVVNARETGGSWRVSAACQGSLTLQSISNGYHHYLRKLASGATCAGGDVDCLKRTGVNLYDAVTSHLGGAWDTSGTLRRVLR
ncbi:MAG: hypothetical protein JO186_04380 [Actinobacteria bacterium]|nr:hypothetical protein [Actinomycetota bacterium]